MIEFYEKFMTKAEVDGVKELIDLTHNGYVVTFSNKILTACAFGLRHQRNGRKLTFFIGKYHYQIKENGRVIKSVIYDEDGVITWPKN